MDDLRAKTVQNIGFNVIAKRTAFLLSAVGSIILAQKLSGRDYSVIWLTMIFIGFLAGFSVMGLTDAVIEKHQLDQRRSHRVYD